MAAGGVLVGRGYVSIRPEFEGDWSRSASSRGSSAGKAGASAFSKAFGVGLKGVGALAGVAVAANLSSVAGAAAAMAPALATAGTAAAALKIGLSGVADAFKAAFADQSADAKAAVSATRAVESAQRGLANAQRALADARVQAAERVKEAQRAVADAERNLADTVEESARRQRDAQVQVRDAERDLRDAQRDAREAQASLTDARREAVRTLEDMNQRLAEGRLDEREAVLRLKEAEEALKAAQQRPGVTPEQLAKLQLAYDRAKLNLEEQRRETRRLADDTKKANKAGVDGSERVRSARERIAAADERVADRQRALAKAQEDAQRAGVEGARAVADAQRSLADAQRGVDKARAEGQRQIEDAQRGVAEAAQALADAQSAAASQTSKLDQAMAKLSPNARSFVNAVRGLAPAWDAMRLSVQDRLFAGLDTTVSGLANTTIPILKQRLTETAGIWNSIAKNAAGGIQEMAKSGMLDKILSGANKNLAVFKDTPKQLITAFGQLTVAAQPAFNGLLTKFAGAIKSFTDGIAKSFKSGGLKQAIDTAFGLISQLGTILGNAFGVVSNIFKAASDAGGQVLGVVGTLLGELKRITAMPEVQAALKSVFAAVAQIAKAIAPVIGSVVRALMPLLGAIAPVIGQLASKLGPVLAKLATALGAALTPIIKALLPVVTLVGDALIQIVSAITPLLKPIGELIGAIIQALLPVLKPIIGIIVQLVKVLVGPLMTVIKALVPWVEMFGGIFGQVFGALKPLIGPIVGLVGKLAGAFATLFSVALKQVMAALKPLIPVFVDLVKLLVQLVTQVLADLMPSLDELIGAYLELFKAVLPLLPILTQLAATILQLGVKVLAFVLPPLLKLTALIVGAYAGAMATAIRWTAKIVGWIVGKLGPAFKWVGGVISKVVNGIIGAFRWLYNVLIGHSILPDIIRYIRGPFAAVFRWLRDNVIRPVMNGIRSAISLAWNKGIRPTFDALKGAVRRVAEAFRTAKDAIARAWDKIREATKKPVNWVINTVWNNGVVKIWKKIAGWIPGVPALGKLKMLAAGGTVGAGWGPATPGIYNRPTAIVGEGNPRHPEYVIPTDPKYRSRARALHQAAGTQLMEDGGILGSIKGIGSRLWDSVKGAADIFIHPGKVLSKLFGPIRDALARLNGTSWGRMAAGLPRMALKGLTDAVRDAVAGGGGGNVSIPAGSGVKRWTNVVHQALRLVSQPLSLTNTTLRRMNQESGGNPRAVNLWDINAKLGHPSVGLMQVIRPTFDAYAGRMRGVGPKMYGVSIDPLANVYSSMRYALSRYGSLSRAYNRPGGYDSGGWLMPGWTPVYNGLGEPEAVVTPRQLRALEGAAAGGVSLDGQRMRLVVGDREFDAYVEVLADGRVAARNRELVTALNANRRG